MTKKVAHTAAKVARGPKAAAKPQAKKAEAGGAKKAAQLEAGRELKTKLMLAAVANAPAKGRPGRKPKPQGEPGALGADGGADAVPEAGDDTVDPSVQVVEKLSVKQRAKDRR
ncbi:MAG: hypothetical protein ACM3PU_07655, partial [Gemmatimonadota bacterium]